VRLLHAFQRLAVRFDVARLSAEVAALPLTAWARHPNDVPGNSAVRLISVDGGENDEVDGRMQPTPHLEQSPYLRQVLASFGVVWSRSRLLRLAAGAEVPEHADINYHWFNRVRMHVPITTQPEVRFHCGGESVHMAAGEAWIFDNWRLHRVENRSAHERIHLVADTSGSASFWQFVRQSESRAAQVQYLNFDADRQKALMTERTGLPPVMSPGELDLLVTDLRSELSAQDDVPATQNRVTQYHVLLDAFCRDWRQLYALHGLDAAGRLEFEKLRDSVRASSRTLSDGLCMASNRVSAHQVLEGRVLRACLSKQSSAIGARPARPIFIVAAPRSGSTLLFETLAASQAVATLGGEAHWLVEGDAALRPGAPGIDSNRLEAEHATPKVERRILQEIAARLQDSEGEPVALPGALRFLEKTPKNSLRIPFFDRIFPDALFVFLWREPRGNIASIIEAWRSGEWSTYPALDGFPGPWSLLLPPGWQVLRGRALEEIAAFQWETTNRTALGDLARLPRERWMAINYDAFIADPRRVVEGLCRFAGIGMDAGLAARLQSPLPLSRFTHTPPAADKWRAHEAAIARVLPSVEKTWRRLAALD